MKSLNVKFAVAAVLMAATAVAFAAKPDGAGGGGGPPDGKGNKPDSEVGNSLSVPAFIVGTDTAPLALSCEASWLDAALERVPETAKPTLYSEDCADTVEGDGAPYCMATGYYFVQRVSPWQAPCVLGDTANAKAAWGDNLVGDASMKVGSPIRVELVLWDSTDPSVAFNEQGYYVIKLQPDELDRNSEYGHIAEAQDTDGDLIPDTFLDIPRTVGALVEPPSVGTVLDPVPYFGAIVFDAAATLRIERVDPSLGLVEVYDGVAGAEINATGKVVYGHNLRVGEAGTYRITYTLPNVTITGIGNVDAVKIPVFGPNPDGGSFTSLDIVVSGGGGGGGRPQ
jgi:hypothetical protein